MTLTDKLISLRKESSLTQNDLAEKMEVSRQAISLWESGETLPSMDKFRRLSELYGVSVDYLINDGAERPAAVAVAERPEEQVEKSRWRKPALIGVAIGLAIAAVIALLAAAYFAGYGKGVEDAKPIYTVFRDTLNEEDLEGGIEIKPLSTPSANVLGEEELEGTFDLTQ